MLAARLSRLPDVSSIVDEALRILRKDPRRRRAVRFCARNRRSIGRLVTEHVANAAFHLAGASTSIAAEEVATILAWVHEHPDALLAFEPRRSRDLLDFAVRLRSDDVGVSYADAERVRPYSARELAVMRQILEELRLATARVPVRKNGYLVKICAFLARRTSPIDAEARGRLIRTESCELVVRRLGRALTQAGVRSRSRAPIDEHALAAALGVLRAFVREHGVGTRFAAA